MPPVTEKLCFVNQFYLYFANRRLERPNDSFYVHCSDEDSPISAVFDFCYNLARHSNCLPVRASLPILQTWHSSRHSTVIDFLFQF